MRVKGPSLRDKINQESTYLCGSLVRYVLGNQEVPVQSNIYVYCKFRVIGPSSPVTLRRFVWKMKRHPRKEMSV